MGIPRAQLDDLQTTNNLKRIDDLEVFRKEFEGKEFDKKVLQSIQESHLLRAELEKIIWKTVKDKIIWIILGLFGIIITDLLLRAVPHILSLFSKK